MPTNRKWFRLTLRSMLVLVLLLGIGLGVFTWQLNIARRQQRAVSDIRATGGIVYMSYTGKYDGGTSWFDQRVRRPSWWRDRLGDDFKTSLPNCSILY